MAVVGFTFNSDGSFPEMIMTTHGRAHVGTLGLYIYIEVEAMAQPSQAALPKCLSPPGILSSAKLAVAPTEVMKLFFSPSMVCGTSSFSYLHPFDVRLAVYVRTAVQIGSETALIPGVVPHSKLFNLSLPLGV